MPGEYHQGIASGRAAAGVLTEDSGTPGLALFLEEGEQVVPNEDVQIDCDLGRGGINDHARGVQRNHERTSSSKRTSHGAIKPMTS